MRRRIVIARSGAVNPQEPLGLDSLKQSGTITPMQFRPLLVVLLFGFASGVFAEPVLKPIFNGKDLSGWAVPVGNDGAGWYQAVDGVLKIQSGPKKKGSILWTQKKYRNFLM